MFDEIMGGTRTSLTQFALVTPEGDVEVAQRTVDLAFRFDQLRMTKVVSTKEGVPQGRYVTAELVFDETHVFTFTTGEIAGFQRADGAGFLRLDEGDRTQITLTIGDWPALRGTLNSKDFAYFADEVIRSRRSVEGGLLLSAPVFVQQGYPRDRQLWRGPVVSILLEHDQPTLVGISQIQFRSPL